MGSGHEPPQTLPDVSQPSALTSCWTSWWPDYWAATKTRLMPTSGCQSMLLLWQLQRNPGSHGGTDEKNQALGKEREGFGRATWAEAVGRRQGAPGGPPLEGLPQGAAGLLA